MSKDKNTSEWQDEGLTKLYRHAHQEQPSEKSDQIILNAAKKQVFDQRQKPRSISWAIPLATAASLLLVVNLVWFTYDRPASIPPVFEDERFELAEEKSAVIHERIEEERREMAKFKHKQLAKKESKQQDMARPESDVAAMRQTNPMLKPAPKASLSAPSRVAPVKKQYIADSYGMNTSIEAYYRLHLAKHYQVAAGRHYILADLNKDTKADWAGLVVHRKQHVALLIMMSHKNTYQHVVLDEGLIKPGQLTQPDLKLHLETVQGLTPAIILTLPDGIVRKYQHDGTTFMLKH